MDAALFAEIMTRLDGLIAQVEAINRQVSDLPRAVIRELDKIDPDWVERVRRLSEDR